MDGEKYLPIGIEDFSSLIKSSYYVDKTDFIVDFLSSGSSTVYLITRPRRFGKSLMLSMLEEFFDCNKNTRSIFENLNIAKSDPFYFNNINSFNVIHLNFKNFSKDNVSDFYKEIKRYMSSIYHNFNLLDNMRLDKYDKKYINDVITEEIDKVGISMSLLRLCELLHKINFKKVVILIDEYDSPILEAYQYGYYNEAVNFFKDFLGRALKGNPYLSRALVTGVIQIAQASIFSGINNFRVDDMINGVGKEYFGFKENEVIDLLSYYHINYDLTKLKEWYGNYLFKGQEIYSNWSILNFVLEGCNYRPFWINTSHYSVFNYFKGNNFITLLNELLNDKVIKAEISPFFSFNDEFSKNQLLSLLAYSGYLKIEKTAIDEVFNFSIANKELKKAIIKDIKNKFINKNTYDLLDNLYQGFTNNDSKLIEENIEKYLLSTWSYFELDKEKNYQIMMLTISSILFEKAYIKSEVTSGEGRLDILIISNDKSFAYILETKYTKSKTSDENLTKSSLTALKQIKEHKYYEIAKKMNIKDITLMGFAFTKNRTKIQIEKM